jgi:hypothetical protein
MFYEMFQLPEIVILICFIVQINGVFIDVNDVLKILFHCKDLTVKVRF